LTRTLYRSWPPVHAVARRDDDPAAGPGTGAIAPLRAFECPANRL